MAEGRTAFPAEPDGWYVEGPQVTAFLIAREDLSAGVWDACCGQGNVVMACLEAGIDAVGTDLRDRVTRRSRRGVYAPPAWFQGTEDFLAVQHCGVRRPNLVFNPPYGGAKLAEAFIRKAVSLSGVEKVAALVNAKFLFSDGRATGLYAELPPHRVYPVRPRPSCPPGPFLRAGGKAEGGVENFVWCVFAPNEPYDGTRFIWA